MLGMPPLAAGDVYAVFGPLLVVLGLFGCAGVFIFTLFFWPEGW